MSEIKNAWDYLKRFGTQQQKELFKPVYLHIQKLEKRIKELELIHDKHMAPQMFKDPPTQKELLIQIQIEKIRKMVNAPIQFFPLKDRLQAMVDNDMVGSSEWLKTLKWNKLTEAQAMEIVNDHKPLSST